MAWDFTVYNRKSNTYEKVVPKERTHVFSDGSMFYAGEMPGQFTLLPEKNSDIGFDEGRKLLFGNGLIVRGIGGFSILDAHGFIVAEGWYASNKREELLPAADRELNPKSARSRERES